MVTEEVNRIAGMPRGCGGSLSSLMKSTFSASLFALAFLGVLDGSAATLRHHYPLNGSATDALGVANLTATGNGVTFPTSGGAAGGFVRLAGTDDYLLASLDAGSAMSLLGDYSTFRPFSVSCWVRQTAAQATSGTVGVFGVTTNAMSSPSFNTSFAVITRESTNGLGVRVRCRNNETGDGVGAIVSGINIADGNWHHLVSVYEAGSRTLYIDGVLRGTNNTAVQITTNPLRYFAIGAFIRAGQILDDLTGDVDDFQVYEGALSGPEALTLFENPGEIVEDTSLPPDTPLADVVDPLYGVAAGTGTGSCVPGACLPHSSIYPSPNTQAAAAGGFAAGSPVVGFAQLHAPGSGSSTMSFGNFLVSPRLGAGITEASHASPISNVIARPYSYRGRLTTWSADCQVVPTANCAIYEFDFPSSSDARINFDIARKLNSATGLTNGSITIDTATGTISGGGTFDGNWNPAAYTLYFYAKVDATPTGGGTFIGSTSQDGTLTASTATRQRLGGWLKFNTTTTPKVRLKIAVSFNSVARAQQYLESEISGWDSAVLEATAKSRWNEALSVVQAPDISSSEARKLYTALFHSLLQPRNRTGDPATWPADAPFWDDHYTLWDTWQTLFPLLAIVDPATTAANINSLGERFARNGRAETAFIQGKDFQVGQGGDEVDRIICDAYVKNIPGIDWSKLWPLLQFNAARRTDDYRNLGYVSTDGSRGGYDSRMASGSSTLGFAHGDWCAAQIGFGLGHNAEAQTLLTRSGNWRNVWDASLTGDGFSGFVRGRTRSGPFTTTAATSGSGTDFYQGTCWNYSFSVPHDQDAIIALMGGRARFIQRLEFAFGKNSTSYLDFSNEVNMKAPAFFSHTGRPYLGSYWNDRIRQLFGSYTIPGDEDSGAMSSLYFFLTTGIYPSATQDIYYLHGSRVPQLEFKVGGGKTFTITATNSGGKNVYVQSATLNGQPLTTPIIRHADIVAGSTLAFVMGPHPSTWATARDFTAPATQDHVLPVNGPWSPALGTPSIVGASTNSPTWGSGANSADNSAIHARFPELMLTQTGAAITLSATIQFSGLTSPQSAPSDRFAWGLFNDGSQSGLTDWTGYLVANDSTDAAGTQKLWRKDTGNATAFHLTGGGTAQTSYALATPAFADGTYTLILTLRRTAANTLDYHAALVRSSDGVLMSAFTGSDTTPPTFAFNHIGFRAGDSLDTDSIQITQCTVTGNSTVLASDTDGDGLPNAWEITNGSNPNLNDATLDNDDDGLNARAEYLFGLDPSISDSYKWSAAKNPATDTVDVTFPTLPQRSYRVFWSPDLVNWYPASSVISGDGTSKSWTDDGSVTGTTPGSETTRFYRVQVSGVL